MKDQYDVLIVGGGMVGAALACCLGKTPLKVAIFEKHQPKSFTSDQSHDLRVSALSIASKKILESVGAWSGITKRRFCPYSRMRVWEASGDTTFDSHEIQQDALGYIVENRIIQLAFLDRLADFDNVDLYCPSIINKMHYSATESLITLEDERTISGRCIVGADGGQSQVRQVAGIGVNSCDYEQQAMVLSVETAYDQQDITWQRFVPSGPQAFLPLDGPHASLVWYHSADEIRRLKMLDNGSLLTELLHTFPSALGEVSRILGKASFPLKRLHALHYVKEGVALVGDSAHMVNPLAGQGVNIGLLDAAALAQVLVDSHLHQQDIGSLTTLERYEAMRRKDNQIMIATLEAFYRVFSNQIIPLKMLRNVGLSLAEKVLPAKKMVMRHAMGLEGHLPKLARGENLL
ncbi:MAG: UbiH/UbiF/VisC/COQ6 family ubiquinone biosynthesis hydroxylase [Methylococcaceae bacterium]